MQILNNQSNINFNGSFRFKPNEIKAKADVPNLFTQGRQVFHNILENGDEVIVVRKNYDKRVASYLKDNNVKGVEYYPEIDTKCGLDDEIPEGLLKLIKSKSVVVIKNLEEIISSISSRANAPRRKVPKIDKELNKIANALRLNIESPKVVSNKSFTRIRDEHKMRTIEVIAPNSGTSYVHVIPDSLNEQSVKCILNGKGQVVKTFDTPNEIHKFNLLFNNLKKDNVNILEK